MLAFNYVTEKHMLWLSSHLMDWWYYQFWNDKKILRVAWLGLCSSFCHIIALSIFHWKSHPYCFSKPELKNPHNHMHQSVPIVLDQSALIFCRCPVLRALSVFLLSFCLPPLSLSSSSLSVPSVFHLFSLHLSFRLPLLSFCLPPLFLPASSRVPASPQQTRKECLPCSALFTPTLCPLVLPSNKHCKEPRTVAHCPDKKSHWSPSHWARNQYKEQWHHTVRPAIDYW